MLFSLLLIAVAIRDVVLGLSRCSMMFLVRNGLEKVSLFAPAAGSAQKADQLMASGQVPGWSEKEGREKRIVVVRPVGEGIRSTDKATAIGNRPGRAFVAVRNAGVRPDRRYIRCVRGGQG